MNLKDLIEKIKEKSNIKTIISVTMIFIFACIINLVIRPKYEIGYARIATKACPLIKQIEFCSSEDFEILEKGDNSINCSECKLISIYEKVIVLNKNNELYDIYRDNKKIGSTKKEDIILETSSELSNLLKEKAAYEKRKKDDIKNIANKQLNEITPKIKKVFTKTDIKKDFYNCSIKPQIWKSLNYFEKTQAFILCGNYGKFKSLNTFEDVNETKIKTNILNSSNNEKFAEYNIIKGYNIVK